MRCQHPWYFRWFIIDQVVHAHAVLWWAAPKRVDTHSFACLYRSRLREAEDSASRWGRQYLRIVGPRSYPAAERTKGSPLVSRRATPGPAKAQHVRAPFTGAFSFLQSKIRGNEIEVLFSYPHCQKTSVCHHTPNSLFIHSYSTVYLTICDTLMNQLSTEQRCVAR